ncbi:MAG TPA: histidine kinase [Gallionella sp.]|nr:histidine kinase [Gallionella sp.]
MNKALSIRQNNRQYGLPNFRNLGTLLRILIISNALALLQSLVVSNSWMDVAQQMMQINTLLTPVLFSSLLLIWSAQSWLNRISYRRGAWVVTSLVVAISVSIYYFGGELYRPPEQLDNNFDLVRCGLLSAVVCGFLLLYFRLRSRILSRALSDARLQVLRARIRPHFLFNTINAVLGIVRAQPRQAEAALEDMADLFRMAMSDAQDLVPLGLEVQLSKQYLALEQMRMGDRLRVDWQIRDVPEDVLIPPLLLQPLLENAVYHGIEPLTEGGSIGITLSRSGDQVHLRVENPCPLSADLSHQGNRVALRNIRERLDLLFDVEANYQVESGKDFYRVEIVFPYVSRVKERPQP